MCGRYYVDDETAGDIHPGKDAPVLSGESSSISCGWQRWGFPGFQGKKLIFNARCESVLEKPLFMAGFSRQYEDGGHFVILTTAANASMEPVHDRMPLILEREEIT